MRGGASSDVRATVVGTFDLVHVAEARPRVGSSSSRAARSREISICRRARSRRASRDRPVVPRTLHRNVGASLLRIGADAARRVRSSRWPRSIGRSRARVRARLPFGFDVKRPSRARVAMSLAVQYEASGGRSCVAERDECARTGYAVRLRRKPVVVSFELQQPIREACLFLRELFAETRAARSRGPRR